jgi:mannose-binding lectin 2
LQLELIWREEDQWDQCFKKRDIVLPEQIYLGFSAHTGEVYDNHDIISIVTKSIPPAVKEVFAPPPNTKKRSGGSGVLSVLFKIACAGGLVGVLFVGYRFYDQRNRMKRF